MKFIYHDGSHRYWYAGKPCSGMTTAAKIGTDTFGVDKWRHIRLAVGLANRPDLAELIVAHHDNDEKVIEYVEDAIAAGKGYSDANMGTAVHRHVERIDLDEPLISTPLTRALEVAWKLALEKAGLEILPEYVERFVIWPDQMVCGRLDRIVRRRSDGRLAILDVKNGKTVAKYPHAVAVQLAGYAHAPLMAGPMQPSGENGSIATEEFVVMADLDIDQQVAYIVHTAGVADGEAAEVLEVDIAEGYKALTGIVFPALRWRKVIAERLMRPIASVDIETGETCNTSTESPATTSSSTPSKDDSNLVSTEATSTPISTSDQPEPSAASSTTSSGTTSRRQTLLARLTALPDTTRTALKAHWPAGVPGFKGDHQHTDTELDAIEGALNMLTAPSKRTAIDVALMKEEPSTTHATTTSSMGSRSTATSTKSLSEQSSMASSSDTRQTTGPPKGGTGSSPLIDEGPLLPAEEGARIAAAAEKLSVEEKAWVAVVCTQSLRAGYSINPAHGPTTRRLAIGRAIIACAKWGGGTDELVRCLLGVVLGTPAFRFATIGQYLASLTIEEADRLADLANSNFAVSFVDGRMQITGPAVEKARVA